MRAPASFENWEALQHSIWAELSKVKTSSGKALETYN